MRIVFQVLRSAHGDERSTDEFQPGRLALPSHRKPGDDHGRWHDFAAPVTVTLIRDGSPVPNSSVSTADVSNPTALTFTAPAVPDSAFLKVPCAPGGSGPLTGTQSVSTVFGIRVTNTLTGCSGDLPNVLLYNPSDTTCHASVAITTASPLTAGVNNSPYSTTFTASGGTPPYTWAITGGFLRRGLRRSR